MIELVIGGSGSGKSAFAENEACKLSENEKRFYIATMQVFDNEGEKKIQKHRKMREDKKFTTIEVPMDIDNGFNIIKKSCEFIKDKSVKKKFGFFHKKKKKDVEEERLKCTSLIECVSNLLANEMFDPEHGWIDVEFDENNIENLANKIFEEIKYIGDKINNCVIVTNNIFLEGDIYDAMTENYINVLACVNSKLANYADKVVEVYLGIPIVYKNEGVN